MRVETRDAVETGDEGNVEEEEDEELEVKTEEKRKRRPRRTMEKSVKARQEEHIRARVKKVQGKKIRKSMGNGRNNQKSRDRRRNVAEAKAWANI